MGTDAHANTKDRHANKTHRQAQQKYVTPQKLIGLSLSEAGVFFWLMFDNK